MITHRKNVGFSMIEILITIVILMIGLLGLAGLQMKALNVQMESYQRAQALILLKDMADRINANRGNAASYITTLNPAAACPAAGATITSTDLNQWCTALLGVAETQGAGNNVGAMIGARGCITQTAAPASGVPTQYLVAVSWQGLNATAAPTLACGLGQYKDSTGAVNETWRRVIALPVNIGCLTC